MGQKTEHSQKVLDALMKNDLAGAGKHAELLRIRKYASWYLVQTGVYKLWSDQLGTLGRCEVCGKAISRSRLDAVPYARDCIRCARAEEVAAPGQ